VTQRDKIVDDRIELVDGELFPRDVEIASVAPTTSSCVRQRRSTGLAMRSPACATTSRARSRTTRTR